MSHPNSRVHSFSACHNTFEIHCPDSLTSAVGDVIGPFGFSGRGEHALHLQSGRSGQTEIKILRWSKRRVDVLLPYGTPRGVSIAVAHSLVKVLAHNQGVLLHAAGLLRDGLAYLFVGRSGAGKTTLVEHASGFKYIHDDNVAVCRQRGRWWAYGVPTLDNAGRPGANVAAPLGGMFLIEKGSQLQKKRLNRVVALHALPENVISPVEDRATGRMLFDTLLTLVTEVDSCRLQFVKDSDVSTVL
jgi:hypothetical protein